MNDHMDLRGVFRGRVPLLIAGAAAIAVGQMPPGTLTLAWPVRLLIGAFGAVIFAISLPAACRWVMNGRDEGEL